jgi:hypothetical protein
MPCFWIVWIALCSPSNKPKPMHSLDKEVHVGTLEGLMNLNLLTIYGRDRDAKLDVQNWQIYHILLFLQPQEIPVISQ